MLTRIHTARVHTHEHSCVCTCVCTPDVRTSAHSMTVHAVRMYESNNVLTVYLMLYTVYYIYIYVYNT
jgi:hypothetical protein